MLLFIFLVNSLFRPVIPEFNGDTAYTYLLKQVEMGYRIPGTPTHKRCVEFINNHLKKYADTVLFQRFNRGGIEFTNIIGVFKGKGKGLLLGAHYDSRPFCEKDPQEGYRRRPLPGANDGASGVAVLLEIARALGKRRPGKTVYLVFFDGEDYGRTDEDMFIGSRYMASNLQFDIDEVIVIDMVGDRDLNVYREGYSQNFSRELNDKVFRIYTSLFKKTFIDSVKYYVNDDHIPFIHRGIPAIDIIDFDYKYWHTHEDTPDKCSPESLRKVGYGLLYYIFRG